MPAQSAAARFLEDEARGLLTRLGKVQSFALHETMVPAAALTPIAQTAIEQFLVSGRSLLRARVHEFLTWLRGPGAQLPPAVQQRRFTLIRLGFNNVLSQFDLFTEVITQRSEHETGVWLSGLDVLASDALDLPALPLDAPPIICYLARGPGAAIRRVKTKLPGGGLNPVAIIRVPRERMVGYGIGSSLVHEVGHQGAAMLGLVESLRPALAERARQAGPASPWTSWANWISEIVADLWSVAQLGMGSTMGLIGVVSLPRLFVFRSSGNDPHPVPWIRVRLSAALGGALYPHPQWEQLSRMWEELYPLDGLPPAQAEMMRTLDRSIPEFVQTLLAHQPRALNGRRLGDVMRRRDRSPDHLIATYRTWKAKPGLLPEAKPIDVFAVFGQTRAAGLVQPDHESRVLSDLLTQWALRSSIDLTQMCAAHAEAQRAQKRAVRLAS